MAKITAVNWNRIEDDIDNDVWKRLTSFFWLPEKIALSNDLPSWGTMTEEEQDVVMKVFANLTLLDTLQGTVGGPTMMRASRTKHEEAVFSYITFNEAVHAKSYSSIFSTLSNTEKIDDVFRWTEENKLLQYKAQKVNDFYEKAQEADDAKSDLMAKAASVLLESFLFYSGFYVAFHWASHGKLTNTADIIRLILRDECLAAGHELLTPGGWKNIEEVTKEDLVAQWSEDGTIQFVHPVALSDHYAEKTYMFETEQGHVRQQVSPGHRMLTQRRSYGRGSSDWKNEVVLAEDYPQTRLNPYARFVGAGELEGAKMSLTPEERLLIAIQADGSFDTATVNAKGEPRRSGVKSGTVPSVFTFAKQRKVDRLVELADEAGWEVRFRAEVAGQGNVRDKKTLSLQVPVDYPRDKRLSSIVNLNEVDANWCREFIEELSFWDGHAVKENPARITWGSTVLDNAKFVQAVAALAGYRTHFRTVEDDRSETFSDYHKVQIHTEKSTYGAQHVVKEEKPGEQVYGVQVPSTYLLTRNDGSVTVTGNSIHGYYIGYKYQAGKAELPLEEQEALDREVMLLAEDLLDNELRYTEEIYDLLGWTEDVKAYVRYNYNKAMNNLGYDGPFGAEEVAVKPSILVQMAADIQDNQDFFSSQGSTYVVGVAEETTDEDWD